MIKTIEEMKKQMRERTITITEEQFLDAVQQASKEFIDSFDGKEDANPMALAVMSMQNMMFGSHIAKILFKESEDK